MPDKNPYGKNTTQGEITCFRISETWRKHATPCFRYVYVLRLHNVVYAATETRENVTKPVTETQVIRRVSRTV